MTEQPVLFARTRVETVLDTLDADETVRTVAADLAARADRAVPSGPSPSGLAAGAIYLAALATNRPLAQAEIAAAAGVTTATVRTAYQTICDRDRGLPDADDAALRGRSKPPRWVAALRAEVGVDE